MIKPNISFQNSQIVEHRTKNDIEIPLTRLKNLGYCTEGYLKRT
jgi:hypothetical protein